VLFFKERFGGPRIAAAGLMALESGSFGGAS
jgi:hypothetical protein